jgi:tryptophan-rich sensory protein
MSDELWKFFVVLILCYGVGAVGALITLPALPDWYRQLRKPAFAPPAWVFRPVWTVLYTLMAVSFFLAWQGRTLDEIPAVTATFLLQLSLNLCWSAAFFGLRSPGGGMILATALLGSVAAMLTALWPVSQQAALLQAPYFLWASFAALLNFRFWQLNPDG